MAGVDYRICHECGSKMELNTISKSFRYGGKEIELKGIEAYVCPICGEIVYTDKEATMIEALVHVLTERPAPQIDVLNLEETASFLRVSNQTIYNMIKSGRIKAYKVGREWRFLRADIEAYLNSTANTDFMTMAAKGGISDQNDLSIIMEEIEKRRNEE